RPVSVAKDHPRDHDGEMFSVLVSRTVNAPRPGSNAISRAFEDAWVGTHGYTRLDGTRQYRAIAFQGHVRTRNGETISEVFIVDLPDDLTVPGDRPLEGTETTRPSPPRGVVQRRLTHTVGRKYPGLQGPRHWLRSSPDGARIAFLMRDDEGIVQIWTISPNGGEPQQLTHNAFGVASAFSWSPDGRWLTYVADNSVFVSDATTGVATRLTSEADDATSPRPEACVFSPDGKRIAYVRPVENDGRTSNQIFVVNR
ncbi:MAG TPA: DPP IV N-terminal domain-containing protein, partial [Lacipirellulaceae bacterium]